MLFCAPSFLNTVKNASSRRTVKLGRIILTSVMGFSQASYTIDMCKYKRGLFFFYRFY